MKGEYFRYVSLGSCEGIKLEMGLIKWPSEVPTVRKEEHEVNLPVYDGIGVVGLLRSSGCIAYDRETDPSTPRKCNVVQNH